MRKLWTMAAVMVAVSFLGLSMLQAQEAKKEETKKERQRPNVEQMFKRIAGEDNVICIKDLEKNPRTKDKAAEILKKWDTDKNGTVDGKEFTAVMKKARAERGQRGEKKVEKKVEKKEAAK